MLIHCFIWSEKRDEKVETGVPSCGTGFIGQRNGACDEAERCVPVDRKGFSMVRKGLSHHPEEPFSLSGRAFSGWNDGCDGEAGELLLMCDSV